MTPYHKSVREILETLKQSAATGTSYGPALGHWSHFTPVPVMGVTILIAHCLCGTSVLPPHSTRTKRRAALAAHLCTCTRNAASTALQSAPWHVHVKCPRRAVRHDTCMYASMHCNMRTCSAAALRIGLRCCACLGQM